MNRICKVLGVALLGALGFVGLSGKAVATQNLNQITKQTPVYVNALLQSGDVARASCPGGHCSHYSHSSHQSHASHYSSRY